MKYGHATTSPRLVIANGVKNRAKEMGDFGDFLEGERVRG
jgi:hypothetical protein